MKQVWAKIIPWNADLASAALEAGADAVVVPAGYEAEMKRRGLIRVIAPEGDLRLGEEVMEWEIRGKEDEEEILKRSRQALVIVRARDWTIIPLENVVAQTGNLVVEVSDLAQARTMLSVLEKGVDGVLLNLPDPAALRSAIGALKESAEKIALRSARIQQIEPLGRGDRVCVDTCTQMGVGQGMLVGNSGQALFLIHAESIENPFVEPRPFRVNAGAVHAYIRVPGGRTRYLSELKAGLEVLLVDSAGNTQRAIVGRVKIEKRPMLLVEAEAEGKAFSVILQNAETIRLVNPQGEPVSVTSLKRGEEILVALEEEGRHFGMKVQESIQEK
ncbi:MAG: 3-dehydroquinate synthase II [candidate division NC10 bacterium]|nr:3-dehydroquinate synthase II [candidate division NC10 bacterium]